MKVQTTWRAMKRLLVPLRYLRIRHPEKRVIDFWLPVALTIAFSAVYWSLPVKPRLGGAEGVVGAVIQLLSLLIPFFVAALAAVATFQRPGLDDLMQGTTKPTLRRIVDRKKKDVPLRRREFLTYLFGYLSEFSIFVFVILVSARMVSPSLMVWVDRENYEIIRSIFTEILVLFLFHLLCATLLALYYLTDRLHRE